jgi:hypothetical protein
MSMTTSILSIKGVGPAAAATLAKHGFTTADEVAAATAEQLGEIPGLSAARSERILADAITAVGQEQPTASNDDAQEQVQAPEQSDSPEEKDQGKKGKKGGKKKKGKKNKKKDRKKNKKKGKKKGKKKNKK